MQYKTEIRDNASGTATYGAAFVLANDGKTWLLIGHTRNYSTYPRMVRARSAAEYLCREHKCKHFPLHTFTAIKA